MWIILVIYKTANLIISCLAGKAHNDTSCWLVALGLSIQYYHHYIWIAILLELLFYVSKTKACEMLTVLEYVMASVWTHRKGIFYFTLSSSSWITYSWSHFSDSLRPNLEPDCNCIAFNHSQSPCVL